MVSIVVIFFFWGGGYQLYIHSRARVNVTRLPGASVSSLLNLVDDILINFFFKLGHEKNEKLYFATSIQNGGVKDN